MARTTPTVRGRPAVRGVMAVAAVVAVTAVRGLQGAFAGATAGRLRGPAALQPQPQRTQVAASTDTFDPWTALGLAPDATKQEARKAYKKLITKYHPDIDPSPEAEAKFQAAVRAHAVVTGEDKDLDTATLLKNAVMNLRNDLEFKQQQIQRLKEQAASEEAEMIVMQEQLKTATEKRDKVTQELGGFGGAALGLLAGGPAGLVLGAMVGLVVKDRDDAFGQIVRGTGTVAKGLVDAVVKTTVGKDEK